MQQKDTVRLLILDTSQNDAEDLLNLLRNAGFPTQAQMVANESEFVEALNKKTWDLCFAHNRVSDFTPFQALAELKKLELDVPSIALLEERDTDLTHASLEAGIKDVIVVEDKKHLLFSAIRELNSLYDRRRYRKAEISLREAEKRCRLLLKSSRDAIAYVHDGMYIYANQTFVELFGYTDFEEDLEGLPIIDMVAASDQDGFKAFLKNHSDADDPEANSFECEGVRDDDTRFPISMELSEAHYDGEDCTQIIIRTDSGEKDQVDLSTHDLITGLMNQAAFTEQLETAVEKAAQQHNAHAMLYISLKELEQSKNQLGPAGINLFMSDVAKTLKQEVERPHLLARVDDYGLGVILFEKAADQSLIYAEKIKEKIANHESRIGDETIKIDTFVGITLVNENTPNAREIIFKAREAANFAGKHLDEETEHPGIHLHNEENQSDAESQHISDLLAKALEKNLFKLVYQPIVSLRGDSGEHYEVLLRMPDEEGNDISPSTFINEATHKGLIQDIERWAIEEAIASLKAHLEQGHNTHILINISADSYLDTSLLTWLSEQLSEARLPGNSLIFQITEPDATTYLKETKEFVKGLRELHCLAAITHFGRAINPFNTLKHLPTAYVKLDATYINELSENEDSKDELTNVVSSLHTQGKLTIAPFVDSASLLPVLWQAGVNYIQGYYIQQPSATMDYDFSMDEDE